MKTSGKIPKKKKKIVPAPRGGWKVTCHNLWSKSGKNVKEYVARQSLSQIYPKININFFVPFLTVYIYIYSPLRSSVIYSSSLIPLRGIFSLHAYALHEGKGGELLPRTFLSFKYKEILGWRGGVPIIY